MGILMWGGNLALLREQGIVPEQAFDGANIHVAADGRYLGGLQVADVFAPKPRLRFSN
jgi:hypothetical protein